MAVVQSLVDVIRKGHTPEDRCTNALVWLLQRCSPEIACQMLGLAGLSVESPDRIRGHVQWNFKHSRPDAVLEFQGPLYVVIETKIQLGMCRASQLRNHFRGAAQQFGGDLTTLLFLSVERSAPAEVRRIAARLPAKIFFLSWQHILLFLESKRAILDHEQQVYFEEFFACIRAEKLWRLFPMTNDELNAFLAHFPEVHTKLEAAKNALNALLKLVCIQAVASSGERAEELPPDDGSGDLPCLYSPLKIRDWHTTSSAYVFINAALRKVGVVLTGYEDERKQKENFLNRWHGSFKSAFAADPDSRTFVWVDKEEDECAGATGYFKPIDGTAGQVFDPSKIEVFADYFYWGYWYELDVADFSKVSQLIAEDFKKLLSAYGPGESMVAKKTEGKTRAKAADKKGHSRGQVPRSVIVGAGARKVTP